jgi:regulator of protease activity HflC (stomatin/prohibitin superfamily)
MSILFIVFLVAVASVMAVAIVLLCKSVYLVQQAEVIIIERLGKYHRILPAGFHVVLPFLDEPRVSTWVFVVEDRGKHYRVPRVVQRIDLREMVYDFPRQNVITRDNVTMQISALIYYQIIDPYLAVYGVVNLPEAIEKLSHSTLRNVIGELDLDETLTSRDRINHTLRSILDEACHKWGVQVSRVELQDVTPPDDIRHAMEKQMRAERERRAVIKEAEGVKASDILQAEGKQQSQVLAAEGAARARIIAAEAEAQARVATAQAEAQAIEMLKKALPNSDPGQYCITMHYINTLPKMMEGKDSKTILVPYEATNVAGALTSLKELVSAHK